MAFSTQREVSDGTLVDVRLQIEFIDREDINVFVDDIPKYVGVDWDWVSDTLFQMREPVPAGQELLVQRATNLAGVLNVFVGGASFDDPTMDENFRQMLFIAQEAREGATLEEIFNNLNMHGYKVQNLGAGTEPGDAINYQQYMDDALGAGAARDQAVAARNTTIGYRDQAGVSAGNAATKATESAASAALAGQRATAAGTSSTQAQASATAAAQSASNASTSAGNAKVSEDNAKLSELAAAGWAATLNLPSALGNSLKWLRQKADESGLEYVAAYTQAAVDGLLDAIALRVKALEDKPSLGWGQTWQNVRASRAFNIPYTNSTGRPIMVSVSWSNRTENGTDYIEVYVGGIVLERVIGYGRTFAYSTKFVVPNGASYTVVAEQPSTVLSHWAELRS